MRLLLGLARLIDGVTAAIGKAVMWLILLAVFVSAGNAIVRKLAPQHASNAWLELQWYLYGAVFMLAAAYTLQQNEHVRIDIFYGSRSRRTQHWIDLFGHVVFTLPFVALMSWMLIPYAMDSYRIGQISTNSGGLMIWPARAILAVGFVLLTLQAVAEIIKKIALLRGLMVDPHPFHSPQEQVDEMTDTLFSDLADTQKGDGK
ncbi:MAG: TRAP transporter small permease subunit [Paracoccaceae bacterium]